MKSSKITIASFTESLHDRLKQRKVEEIRPSIAQTGKVLSFVRTLLIELKDFVASYQFENSQEEISFFKHHKPILLSQYHFHKRKLAIELFDAFRDEKSRLENYHHALSKMQAYIAKHQDFYEYCMSGSTYLDPAYFTRNKKLIPKIKSDDSFSTGYDGRFSKILAIEMMRPYVFDLIEKLENYNSKSIKPALTWTSQKVDLIELIYALQGVGSFNNASLDVRKIVEAFETAFNVDLGNYYRTFVSLRMRKNGYTTFLDRMKEKLEQRISDIDER